MGAKAGVGELEIQFAILELMKDRRVWSNADLKHQLVTALPWTDADRQRSPSRPAEWVWENRVNNALGQSEKRSASLYAKGHVENCGHGLHRITERGFKFIADDW